MKTIVDDPEDFFENGGWSFLDSNSGDEDENEDEEEDDAYNPSGSELEEVDDSNESDYSEDSASSEDEDDNDGKFNLISKLFEFIYFFHKTDNSLNSSEESGKDWSELEEEAARADRNHGDIVDDYTAKKRKAKVSKRPEKDAIKRKADSTTNKNSSNKKMRKH